VSGCDAQQRQGRSLGISAALFPVSQRVDADTQSIGELLLRQADESSEDDDVFSTQNLTADDALALLPGNGTREIVIGQLGNVAIHVCPKVLMKELNFLLRCVARTL